MDYLEGQIACRENKFYKAGAYIARDSPRVEHPMGFQGTTNADVIVQKWYERRVDSSTPNLPSNLTSKEQYAALCFSGKGIVVIKATNFERHDEILNVMELLSSVRFIGSPYFGFRYGLCPATITFGHFPRCATNGNPKLCFHCGGSEGGKSVGSSGTQAKVVDFKRCS